MVTTGAYRERQQKVSVVSEVRSYLELARNYAVTMQWPVAADTVQEYTKVEIVDGGKIIIKAIPRDAGAGEAIFKEKVVASAGVTISSPDSPFCFSAYDAKVSNCSGVDKSVEIFVGDDSYKVLVNQNGQINQVLP